MIEFSYKPDWLWLALAATAATAFVLWSYSTAIGRPKKPLRFLLFGLRLLVLAGVLLCLLDPQRVERLEHPQSARLAVLLDTSRSMAIRDLPQDRLTTAETWLRDTVLPVLPPNANGPNTGFRPPNPGGPNSGFRPPHHGAPPSFAGHGHDGDDWRRRPRRYWLGGGPIFVPDPSGDYVYSDDDYDDGSDPTGCWVYRKAYDGAGRFLGFVRVDLCEGQ